MTVPKIYDAKISRRALLGTSLGAGIAPVALGANHHAGEMISTGEVNHQNNGFNPADILTDWDIGEVSQSDDGRTIHSYDIVAIDKEIEIAGGLKFPAWTYGGRVPGPTIRVTEGDIVRIRFQNAGSHPHSMHFHGIHPASMDGMHGAGLVGPGEEFTYQFDAYPFGCHLYHCHANPLRRHVHKGLYGAYIIDPDPSRHPENAEIAQSRLLGSPANKQWQELLMVMNGFDVNFDDENEVYAVNSIAHAFAKEPIRVDKSRPIRIYLINITEFDPLNSFHIHANFFDYFDHGTTLTPTSTMIDTVMQCQGQRGILEFSFKDHEPGRYMFHAHQAEFAEQGWSGFFDVA